VPSVDSAEYAESTDGTLTKSAMKTVLFQYSKYTYLGGWCGAGAVFHDTAKTRRDIKSLAQTNLDIFL